MAAAKEDSDAKEMEMTVISHQMGDNTSSGTQRCTGDDQEVAKTADAAEDDEYPTGLRFWLILASLAAVTTLTAIDQNIVATAVPTMTDYFHSVLDVGWYATAFRLTFTAFQFLFGKAYTLFPTKPVFLICNGIWLIGIVICGAATSPIMFIVGRAIAGLGSAGLMSGGTMILVHIIPVQKRPFYQGIQGALEGVSVLAGPLLGGVLTQYLGWRWCFWINLPFGGFCIIFTAFCLANDKLKQSDATFWGKLMQLDVISNLLVISALTCLFLALTWAGTKYSWESAIIIGLLVTFAVLSLAFVYNQYRRGDEAVLPLRLFKNRSVVASLIFVCALNSAGNTLDYYLPSYFQAAHGYSPAQSGYLMIPIIVGGTIGAIAQGILTGITGHYGPFMLLASVFMSVATGLITTFDNETGLAKLIVYTVWSGLSYGIGICTTIALQVVLPRDDIPLGMSTMLFVGAFGPAVSIALGQVLFTNGLSRNLKSIAHFDRTHIESNGLMEIVASVPAGQKRMVLEAVCDSIRPVWYLTVGLSCLTIVGTVLIEWRSIKPNEF